MDATFNIQRFVSYEKRDLNLIKKHILIIVGILTGLYAISLMLNFGDKIFASQFINIIMQGIGIIIIIVSPCIFEPSLDKNKSIFNFILPASNFERFLGLLVKYIIFIPVLIFAYMLILDQINGLLDIKSGDNLINYIKDFYLNAITIQSIFIAGYLYFRKYAVIKTSLLLIGGAILAGFISYLTLHLYTSDEVFFISADILFSPARFVKEWTSESNALITVTDIIFKVIFPFGFWIVSYFKLNETEI